MMSSRPFSFLLPPGDGSGQPRRTAESPGSIPEGPVTTVPQGQWMNGS